MMNRDEVYNSLKEKMENAGFVFEKEQKPHLQNKKETELKFIHPKLLKKLEAEGYKVRAKKFYIKPLTNESDSEIGFVTGKSTPFIDNPDFSAPNSIDPFDNSPAWTNRVDNHAIESLLESIKKYLSTPSIQNINTFLFTWNPEKWEWLDLQESIDRLDSVGFFHRQWSCGNSKSIRKGDRIFLIRLGKEPKGIMGSGYAKSSYYTAPHWDGIKEHKTNYIDIDFDILLNPDKGQLFGQKNFDIIDSNKVQQWFPQQSGISIKKELLDSLENNWFNFITKNGYIKNAFISDDVISDSTESFQEGKSKEILQTRYERNPQARKICLKHHGYSCKICSFNFENSFGETGSGYIHVHHINPIAEIGKEYIIDPIEDLIPVCPNCHAMIHSKRPAYSIEEILKIRKFT